MPVPSQDYSGFPSFPVVNWFCLFVDLWVMPFHLEDCSVFSNFVITLIPRPRRTKYGKNSFRYEAARLWNTLPCEVRNMSSFDQFKNYISDWCGGEKCSCSSCKHQAVLSHAWIVSCLITYFICIICVCLLFIWSNLLLGSYLLFMWSYLLLWYYLLFWSYLLFICSYLLFICSYIWFICARLF